ncbi:MAG: glycosyltransferase family 4 protein [Hyphomicrobiales bacterium]
MRNSNKGRVLFVTSSCPQRAGDWTSPFILDLACDLQSFGWQVDVLAPHAPGLAHQEQLCGVQIFRYPYFKPENQETVFYRGGALVNMRKHPLNWVKLPVAMIALNHNIYKHLRTSTYDLLHSHWIVPQGALAGRAAKRFKLPHVTTAHGSDVFGLQHPLALRLKRYALDHADAITANSNATANKIKLLKTNGCTPHIVPMSITAPGASHAEKPADSALNLLFLGRMVREKGIEELITALPEISASLPNLRVTLAGDGQDRMEMEKLVNRINLNHIIQFSGAVSPADTSKFYQWADIVTCPSHFEAQGMVAAEALAHGNAVVASDVGGLPDTVQHLKTGLLVPPHDARSLAQAVIKLGKDADLRRHLAEKGRLFTEENLIRPASARLFDDIYRRVITSHRHAHAVAR